MELLRATRRRPGLGKCFTNAFGFMPAVTDLTGEMPLYVEGLAVTSLGVSLAHAWLETADGRIVDVTFGRHHSREENLSTTYTPVARFTVSEVLEHTSRRGQGRLPIVRDELVRAGGLIA